MDFRFIRIHVYLVSLLLFLAACDSGNPVGPDPDPSPDPTPSISSISPESGQLGDEVTITGEHFGATVSENHVTFNGEEASLTSASETELVAEVPTGAGTGVVEVTVDGETATGPEFTYIETVTVSTVAGDGTQGYQDGPVESALFNLPSGVAMDGDGNLYVCELDNSTIRKITPDGQVSTLAGSPGETGFEDGTGESARFYFPTDMVSSADGTLYLADYLNHAVRMVSPTGDVTTLAGNGTAEYADGVGDEARFNEPFGVFLDDSDNLYVGDSGNNRIRMVTLAGEASTVAGSGAEGNADGSGTEAQFYTPTGVALGNDGVLYVADANNHRIRTVSSTGEVSTLAGSTEGFEDGQGSEAAFNLPIALAVDSEDRVYVIDGGNHSIRRIDPNGQVTTIAGNGNQGYADGPGDEARFHTPYSVVIDDEDNLYVTDAENHSLRKITIE